MEKEGVKACGKCKEVKAFSKFGKKQGGKNSLSSKCKSCKNKYNHEYSGTKKGLLNKIYNHQKSSSKYRAHPMPSYTKEQLIEFALTDIEFNCLFTCWHESGRKIDWTPSFDRNDDSKPYALDNGSFVPWWMNRKKANSDRKKGLDSTSKPVIGISVKTGIETEYVSINKAAGLGISRCGISGCCSNKRNFKTAGGYTWKFKKK